MSTWKFFADAGMTTQLASLAQQLPDTGGSTETVVYFGSSASGKTLQAAGNAGTDPITITPADSAGGSGLAASSLRLALSYAGLASATPGAGVAVGSTLASGAPVAVYVRLTLGATAIGSYSDLSLTTNSVIEA